MSVRSFLALRWNRGLSLLLAAALGAVFVVGAQVVWRFVRRGAGANTVLATVDNQPIYVQEFEAEMQRRGGETAFGGAPQRRALLDDMIRIKVLASNATKAGYLANPDVQHEIQQLLAERYQHDRIDEPLAGIDVSDTEVEDYYRTHVANFTTPESAHVAAILIAVPLDATDEQRQALRERAAHVRDLAMAASGKNFADLAAQYSDDAATRGQGGDLGSVVPGQDGSHWEPALLGAIFELDQPGQVSAVVSTPAGFYIAQLIERKPRVIRPLSEVRSGLNQQLVREERQRRASQLYAAALAQVPVTINEAGITAMEAAEQAVVNAPRTETSPQG